MLHQIELPVRDLLSDFNLAYDGNDYDTVDTLRDLSAKHQSAADKLDDLASYLEVNNIDATIGADPLRIWLGGSSDELLPMIKGNTLTPINDELYLDYDYYDTIVAEDENGTTWLFSGVEFIDYTGEVLSDSVIVESTLTYVK